jgi:uncharacterized protein DUF1116
VSTPLGAEIDKANSRAVERAMAAEAVLTEIRPAGKAIPGFKPDLITYAGPPIVWEKMIKPQKIAIINVMVHEGLADTAKEAEKKADRGDVRLEHNHKLGNTSGMCGVTSASLPVMVVSNKVHGNRAYNWQQTDMTAFGDEYKRAIKEIRFVEKVLSPVMTAVLKEAGGFNVKEMLAKGLQMGDELHGNFDACRGIFLNWALPYLPRTGFSKAVLAEVGDYFVSNLGRWYCGNMMMAGCKAMMDVARDMKYSTVVVAMARNGVDFGIQVSGLGTEWFTGPAGVIKGFVFPGFKAEDSTLDVGDSAISETRGLGGTASAASPGHSRFVGKSWTDVLAHTNLMRQASVAEDPLFRIPYLDFRGVPVGLDIRKVLELQAPPKINTAMCHKDGGHGMIGAGAADAPLEPFKKAVRSFVERYGK